MDELDSLLGEVRSSYSPSSDSRKRVRRGVAAAVGGGAAVGISSVGEASSAGAELSTGTLTETAVTGVKVGANAGGSGGLLSSAAAKWGAVLVLTGGAFVGVFAYSGEEAPSQPAARVSESIQEQPAEPVAIVVGDEGSDEDPRESTVVSLPTEAVDVSRTVNAKGRMAPKRVSSPSHAEISSQKSPPQESTLKEELSLLRKASAELHRGRASSTLEILAKHRRLYPKSVVATEREGLRVLAQCANANTELAQGAALRFLERAPNSPLAPHIRKSCLK